MAAKKRPTAANVWREPPSSLTTNIYVFQILIFENFFLYKFVMKLYLISSRICVLHNFDKTLNETSISIISSSETSTLHRLESMNNEQVTHGEE